MQINDITNNTSLVYFWTKSKQYNIFRSSLKIKLFYSKMKPRFWNKIKFYIPRASTNVQCRNRKNRDCLYKVKIKSTK